MFGNKLIILNFRGINFTDSNTSYYKTRSSKFVIK